MILLPGIFAFGLFVLFDLNKIKWHVKFMNVSYAVGCLLLIASTVLCIVKAGFYGTLWELGWLAAAVVCMVADIYTLFFALPFRETYAEGTELSVISDGVYGWCRHPSFWPFLMIYLCLWIGFGGKELLAALILFPASNGLYIYIQDRWIFPLFIQGYEAYRRSVPFLIPRRKH